MRSELELETPAGTRPAAITATDLRKHYRLGELRSLKQTVRRVLPGQPAAVPGLDVLRGVSFEIGRGEAVGIVGTNGSGKSTLLQILAGTTLPTSGTMRVRGRVLPLLAVGSGFHPELTGRENVTLFASSIGFPAGIIEDRMDAVTEFAELERHMETPLKRFSSGMGARLSFSIAMQFPADIYVFDEVLAVVDGEFQARCLEEINKLHRAGRTIFFVSHDLDQVAAVCERVLWLEQGLMKEAGPASRVLAAYEHAHGGTPDGH
jgi:ABC-type polysaccharide/polyol phosphate transport system ATPase subunit